MNTIANILVGLVAVLHVYFFILESFLWTKPAGLRAFGQKPEQAKATEVMAQNQGVYNGFLAAGLFWALFQPVDAFSYQLKMFFLLCVLIAGGVGAMTASRKILFVQAIPALVAMVFVYIAWSQRTHLGIHLSI